MNDHKGIILATCSATVHMTKRFLKHKLQIKLNPGNGICILLPAVFHFSISILFFNSE